MYTYILVHINIHPHAHTHTHARRHTQTNQQANAHTHTPVAALYQHWLSHDGSQRNRICYQKLIHTYPYYIHIHIHIYIYIYTYTYIYIYICLCVCGSALCRHRLFAWRQAPQQNLISKITLRLCCPRSRQRSLKVWTCSPASGLFLFLFKLPFAPFWGYHRICMQADSEWGSWASTYVYLSLVE